MMIVIYDNKMKKNYHFTSWLSHEFLTNNILDNFDEIVLAIDTFYLNKIRLVNTKRFFCFRLFSYRFSLLITL